jgi:glucose/arabinose dehydrogenase
MESIVYEETLTVKEFAAYIGASYHSWRRLLIKYGGYLNIGTGETNETRKVPRQRADELKQLITKKKNGGRP